MRKLEEEYYIEEYEIDLREYLRLLWKKKWFILTMFLFFVLAAAIYSFFMVEPVYESSLSFMAPAFTLLDGEVLTGEEYIAFIHNKEVEERVMKKIGLKGKNPGMNADDLDKNLEVELDSTTITLYYRGNNPELIAKILNCLFEEFKIVLRERFSGYNNLYLSQLESYRDEQKQLYIKVKQEVSNLEKEVNFVLHKRQLNNYEFKLIEYENRLKELNRIIERKEIEYQEVCAQLKDIPEEKNLYIIQLELVNIKNSLEQQLSGYKVEADNLKSELIVLEKEIDVLRQEIIGNERRYKFLNGEYTIAHSRYLKAENDYNAVYQSLQGKNYNLVLIRNAKVSRSPIKPNVKLNLAVAGVLGLMLGVFIVFFVDYMKEDEYEEEE